MSAWHIKTAYISTKDGQETGYHNKQFIFPYDIVQ